MDFPAHHPKSDVPTEHEVEMARLHDLWRLRQRLLQAGEFVPVDPRTERAALQATRHFARRLHRAGIFLAAVAARRGTSMREIGMQQQIRAAGRRALIRVLKGGRR